MNFSSTHYNFILSLVFLSTLIACSTVKSEVSTKDTLYNSSSSQSIKTSDIEKHQFKKKFTEQCIEKEIKNSVNREIDKKRFEKPCLCITTKVMQNLSEKEMKSFLIEQKYSQSLKMSINQAAYFCVEKKHKPRAPTLFGK